MAFCRVRRMSSGCVFPSGMGSVSGEAICGSRGLHFRNVRLQLQKKAAAYFLRGVGSAHLGAEQPAVIIPPL